MKKAKAPLRPFLVGGDRRSIAQSGRALALILADHGRLPELAGLAADPDWLVSMRALDLLEKLAHRRPAWVQPYKDLFIGPLADSDKWEIRLQIVRTLPLLEWTKGEWPRVMEILARDMRHPQKFVCAWAVSSVADLALRNVDLRPLARNGLKALESSGNKALVARARRLRERLGERISR